MKKLFAVMLLFMSVAVFAQETSNWTVKDERSEMDGRRTVTISMTSQDDPGTDLAIRCLGNRTEVFIYTDDVLDGHYNLEKHERYVYVRVKFDEEKPSFQFWDESTNMRAAFAQKPDKILKQLVPTKTFRIEYTPFQKGPKVATFNMGAFKDQITPYAGFCRYKE